MLKIKSVKEGQQSQADLIVLLFLGMVDPAKSIEKVKVQVGANKGEKQVFAFNLEDSDTKEFLCSEFAAAYIKAYGNGNGLEKAIQEYKKTGKLGEIESGTAKMLMTHVILSMVENTFEFNSDVTFDLNSDEGWSETLQAVVTPVNWYVAATTAPDEQTSDAATSEEAATTPPPVTATAPPAVGSVETPAETPAPTTTSEVSLPAAQTALPVGMAIVDTNVMAPVLKLVGKSMSSRRRVLEAILEEMKADEEIVEQIHAILVPQVKAEG